MNRLPIYGKKTLLLSFEFGLILSQTAKEMNVELTPEIIANGEMILINELRTKGLQKTACNFASLVLAALEV